LASEFATTPKAIDHGQPSGNQDQACYDGKLKDFRKGMREEAPVSNEMMNERRSQGDPSPA
jgi:hypothetical protein